MRRGSPYDRSSSTPRGRDGSQGQKAAEPETDAELEAALARALVSPATRRGFGAIAREVHARYRLPLMLAETNNYDERAVDWLAETWNDTVAMRDAGLPIRGFCWYSLTDQVDWDTCMREANDTVNSFGLVDMARVRRPVGHAYEALARQARAGITVAMPRGAPQAA